MNGIIIPYAADIKLSDALKDREIGNNSKETAIQTIYFYSVMTPSAQKIVSIK